MPTKKPKHSRKPHKHIPALGEKELAEALERLQTLSINEPARKKLAAMLKAAANPNAEAVDVVIASLEPERRANITETEQRLTAFTGGLIRRGREALAALSDDEWDRLVEDANEVNPSS